MNVIAGTWGTVTHPGSRLDGKRVQFLGWQQGYPWVRLDGPDAKPFVWSHGVAWDRQLTLPGVLGQLPLR